MRKDLVRLGDRNLFGNEAAEDEDAETFQSYAYEREEVDAFSDADRRLCVVRAYKGEGKSALLRLSEVRIRRAQQDALVLSLRGPQISPERDDNDFDAWARDWKVVLISQVAEHIGAKLSLKVSDEVMSLVELANKGGVRERGFVEAVLARIPSFSIKSENVEASVRTSPPVSNPESVVRRWASGREPIWVLVDDIDQNFANTPKGRAKVGAFFSACRHLIGVIPELRMRVAVRPNVWTTIKHEFESLSHIEQYVTDLRWSEAAMRSLLSRLIQGYLVRSALWSEVSPDLPTDSSQRERFLISLVFDDPMEWGKAQRPPHVVLHTLSKRRPRWMIELCGAAGSAAARGNRRRILLTDLTGHLEEFGKKRVEDTVAEFKSQCSDVAEIVGALKSGEEEYSTAELVQYLGNHVMNHITPRISGVVGTATALDVAAFLFEIGVVFGRREGPSGYTHVSFSDDPYLLKSRTNLDDGLRWEVHPVFRQVLGLRDNLGREQGKRGRRTIPPRKPTP